MSHFSYGRALVLAVLLHGLILGFFLVSSDSKSQSFVLKKSQPTQAKRPIVQAISVDQKQVAAEIATIKRQARRRRLKQAAIKRRARQRRLAERRRERRLKAKAARALSALKRKQNAAKKQLALMRKKIKREQRKADQAKQRAKQRAKQQAKQKADQAKRAKRQGEVNRYKALIIQAIERRWLVPANASRQLRAKLSIRLAPGGRVVSVNLIRSSGNTVLDRSAIAAVYKASPLPVPVDPTAFSTFRSFNLTVQPTQVFSGESHA